MARPDEIGRHRPRRRRRRNKGAEAVEHAARRNRFVYRFALGAFGLRNRACAGKFDDALEHVDERARKRQIRPARIAGDVEQYDQSFAASRRGDQRRPVRERRPGIVAQCRVGFGKNLAGDGHVGRHRHAGEWAVVRKSGKRLRLIPAQAAAQDTAAAPQFYWNEIIVGGGREARAGKTHEHAAVLDPLRSRSWALAGDSADICQDQHRQFLIDEMRHRVGRRLALRNPQSAKGPARADVIARRQQRFGRIGGRR